MDIKTFRDADGDTDEEDDEDSTFSDTSTSNAGSSTPRLRRLGSTGSRGSPGGSQDRVQQIKATETYDAVVSQDTRNEEGVMIENRVSKTVGTLNIGGPSAAVAPSNPKMPFDAPKLDFGKSSGITLQLSSNAREHIGAPLGGVGDHRRTATVIRSHRRHGRRSGSLDGRPSSPLWRVASNRGSSTSPERTASPRRPGPYDRPSSRRTNSVPRSPGHSRRVTPGCDRATPEPRRPPAMALPPTNIAPVWPGTDAHKDGTKDQQQLQMRVSPSPSPAAQAQHRSFLGLSGS